MKNRSVIVEILETEKNYIEQLSQLKKNITIDQENLQLKLEDELLETQKVQLDEFQNKMRSIDKFYKNKHNQLLNKNAQLKTFSSSNNNEELCDIILKRIFQDD